MIFLRTFHNWSGQWLEHPADDTQQINGLGW